MAIIQISKIQQRSGNLVDLPQLDEAQLGWANDAKRLFIGTTTPNPNENVEVLTSYSNITFSQINGSEGNLNISNAQTGQILTYVASTNTWNNAGGNALQPGNSALYSNANIHLGDVATIKIGGGAIGYVLETDGVGNLTWTPKSTITAYISAVTKANPGVVTTTEDNFFTEGADITITNVGGMVELNGGSYYVNILTSNTFALYSDSGLTIPVNTTGYTTYTTGGRVISSVGGAGTSAAGGSNTTIQFNDNNVIQGNAGFTFNKITGAVGIPGNVTAINATLGNLVTSNYFAGVLTTAAQPNITSVGTLTSLTVTGNTTSGNLNTAGTVTASRLISNIATGTAPLTVTSTTQVANLNVATAGLATFATTANAVAGANVSGQVGNALVSGTVYTNAQPNITTVGTLTTVTVSGNANVGNLGTAGLIIATGNITGGNIIGIIAAGSNTITTTGNITGGNVIASNFVGAGAGIPSISSSGSLSISATSGVTINNLISLSTGSNTTAGNITGNFTLTAGSKLQATYADLAEYYEADAVYEPGTILEFGGDKEVTIAEDSTTRVAGVVSTNPAYAMNANCKGIAIAIALQGRVPTKVCGTIHKGDMMVSGGNGFAKPSTSPQMGTVIGKALENFDGIEGIIEIAVGRL
jgi:phage tail protein X